MTRFHEGYGVGAELSPESAEIEKNKEDIDDELEFFGLTHQDLKDKKTLNYECASLSEHHRELGLDVVSALPLRTDETTGRKTIPAETEPDSVHAEQSEPPFKDESFDMVLAAARSEQAMAQAVKLVRKNGEVRIIAPQDSEPRFGGMVLELFGDAMRRTWGEVIETKIYDLPNKHTKRTWPVLIIKRLK